MADAISGQVDWRWLVGAGAGLAVLLIGLVIRFARRPARQVPRPPEAPEDRMIRHYRAEFPVLSETLAALQREGRMVELRQRGDARAALKLLELGVPSEPVSRGSGKQVRRKPAAGLLLERVPAAVPGSPDRRRAAALTILRAAYMDDQLRSCLPPELVAEMDRFLDSLTG